MRALIVSLAVVSVFSGNAYAGQGYDACLKQEQVLRSKEASQCSGLQYLFNPSGCFVTRKALKEFADGKCSKIGKAENVPQASQSPNAAPAAMQSGPAPASAAQEARGKQVVAEHAAAQAQSGPKQDLCRKEERELRDKVAGLCSGANYLFNPSACFSTKKLLKEYDEGKCRKTDAADGGLSKARPEKTAPTASPPAVMPTTPAATASPPPAPPKTAISGESAIKTGEAGSLHEENARIKAENERLKAELEQLRKNIGK